MTQTQWTDADTARAVEIWDRYQSEHDVSRLKGQIAGVDPVTGEVRIDESAKAIVMKRRAEGFSSPLYFVRVGFNYYVRK